MPRPPWPPDRARKIIEMAGKFSGHEIARAVGVRYANLVQWSSRHGITLRKKPSKDLAKRVARLQRKAVRQGLTLQCRDGKARLLDQITEWDSLDEVERLLDRRHGPPMQRAKKPIDWGKVGTAASNATHRDPRPVSLPRVAFLDRAP